MKEKTETTQKERIFEAERQLFLLVIVESGYFGVKRVLHVWLSSRGMDGERR